jgi:DNA-binding MarR family transcriptional regulator
MNILSDITAGSKHMRHRHRPELKPTDRLVLAALTTTTVPLSVAELSEATGSAPTTLTRTTRLLERRGLINRHRIGGLSNFALAATTTTTAATEVSQ